MANHSIAPNAPLNVPALEALESMTGSVPTDIRDQILAAPFNDDLSGLREMGHRIVDVDEWQAITQPKAEIADYAEANEIRVPKRYESLDEAMREVNQGKTIIVRSEHPQEYDGFSGLLHSYRINLDELEREADREERKQDYSRNVVAHRINQGLAEEDVLHYAKHDSLDSLPLVRYLAITEQDKTAFYDAMSYSFWEYVPGENVMVVADDAIADRYHITGFGKGIPAGAGGGIYHGDGSNFGEMPIEFTNIGDPFDADKRAELIEIYEAVRSLPKFSARNCPIMEMQVTEDGTVYFLQYHKARPFRASDIELEPNDYPTNDGWFKSEVVRGALGSLVTLKTALWYPPSHHSYSTPAYIPEGHEEASCDLHYDIGLTEFASPTRTAYLGHASGQMTYLNMADGSHEVRSRWFKPSAALTLRQQEFNGLISNEQKDLLLDIVHRERRMGRFMLDYASDGLAGYVRLSPDADGKPIFR